MIKGNDAVLTDDNDTYITTCCACAMADVFDNKSASEIRYQGRSSRGRLFEYKI